MLCCVFWLVSPKFLSGKCLGMPALQHPRGWLDMQHLALANSTSGFWSIMVNLVMMSLPGKWGRMTDSAWRLLQADGSNADRDDLPHLVGRYYYRQCLQCYTLHIPTWGMTHKNPTAFVSASLLKITH